MNPLGAELSVELRPSNLPPSVSDAIAEYSLHGTTLQSVNNEYRDSGKIEYAHAVELADPYRDIVGADEELQTLFSGAPAELIVLAIQEPGLTRHYHQNDPSFIAKLLYNQTAKIIAADCFDGRIDKKTSMTDWPEEMRVDAGARNMLAAILYVKDPADTEVMRFISENPALATRAALDCYLDYEWSIKNGREMPNLDEAVRALAWSDTLTNVPTDTVLEMTTIIEDSQAFFDPLDLAGYKKFVSIINNTDIAGEGTFYNALTQVFGVEQITKGLYKTTKRSIEEECGAVDDLSLKELVAAVRARHQKVGKKILALANTEEINSFALESALTANLTKVSIGWQPNSHSADGTIEALHDTVKTLQDLPSELLSSRYKPSEVVRITRRSHDSQPLSDDMKKKLKFFIDAQHRATNYLRKPTVIATQNNESHDETIADRQRLSTVVITEDIYSLIDEAKERLKDPNINQKFVSFQIDQLEELKDYDFNRFPHDIARLAKYKSHIGSHLATLLMDGVDVMPFLNNAWLEGDLDALTRAVEKIQHDIIGRALDANPGLCKADQQAIGQIMSTKVFDPLLASEKSTSTETLGLQFVPVRGLLMEASGHIADTCWAEKMNITKDHPNMDAVIFVQKDAKENSPSNNVLAGACMLIRTNSSKKGVPLLIIRGLNPSQSLLNKVNIHDFYEQLTDYVEGIAQDEGRRVAVVIDSKVGRATTNRPEVFAMLTAQQTELNPVTVPKNDTTFNGYDISHHTYFV